MMAIAQKKMNVGRSICEMLQFVGVSFTETIDLEGLFAKPNFNIINELNDYSSEPALF